MPENSIASNAEYQFSDILKQINFANPKDLANPETGKRIGKQIYLEQNKSETDNKFFRARSFRWMELLKWATGTQDMTQFLDFFNISDANKAFVKIDMTPIMVGPQFVGTLVESMSKNDEYPCVTAIDDSSLAEKEDRKADALYLMHERENIAAMQQSSGIALEPPNAYVPDSELAADVFFELEDRLPKEIRFERKLEDTLSANQYKLVLKPRFIYDLIVYNCAVSKLEKYQNKIVIRKCVPQNIIYNFFLSDTGKQELRYIGEIYGLKISDIRTKFDVSEKDLFEMAKTATQNNAGVNFKYEWQEQYNYYNYNRPWDDYLIYVLDYEIQLEESDYFVSKPDSYGKDNIAPKKGIPQPTSDKAKVLRKDKKRWYRGVYALFADKILYWGLPDLVLFPYNDIECGLSSYTINIPKNNGFYVPSLFERAMEPLKEYALTKLKRKQLIAKLRPSGIRIDVESARNINLGGGNTIPWEEVVRIFDQTGNELWSSKGLDPDEKGMPALSPVLQDDTMKKIMELTNVLAANLSEIRGLLGVPNYRDGSDVGERTAAKLADQQNVSSFNVTDFIHDGHNELMQETLYKVCLAEWQNAVKTEPESKDDLINSVFDVSVEMKLSAYEREILEQNIAVWSKTVDGNGKPLLSPKDVFVIRNIKNYKSAQMYLANVVEQNDKKAKEESMQLQEANAKVQQQSAQQASEQEAQIEQMKAQTEAQRIKIEAHEKNKTALITGLFDLAGKGIPVPQYMVPLIQELIPNITMPLAAENDVMQYKLSQGPQQQEEMQEQPQQQQPEPQMQ